MVLFPLVSAMTVISSSEPLAISTETYVASIDQIDSTVTINNVITFKTFPSIKVKNIGMAPGVLDMSSAQAGQIKKSFNIAHEETYTQELYASTEINLKEDVIEYIIHLENSAEREEIPVEVDVLSQTDPLYFYAAYVEKQGADYILVSPQANDIKGNALALFFSDNMPSFPQTAPFGMKTIFEKFISWNINLGPKEKRDIVIKIVPGYVTDQAMLKTSKYSPSVSKQYLLQADTDPLFKISNLGSVLAQAPTATESGKELIKNIQAELEGYASKEDPTGMFEVEYDMTEVMDKRGAGLDSTELSLIFREMCRLRGIPADIHLGFKDDAYYAWSMAYLGGAKYTYDPSGQKGQFKEVYTEPMSLQCSAAALSSCPWSRTLRLDIICIGNFCISVVYIIIAILLLGAGVFITLQLKPGAFYSLVGKEKEKAVIVKGIDGKYNLEKTEFTPANPLEEYVWEEMKRRDGNVNVSTFARETKFSEVLIASVIEKFQEKGLIKKDR